MMLGSISEIILSKRFHWMVSCTVLCGSLLNALKYPASFTIWACTNAVLICINIKKREWPWVAMFSGHLLTSLLGIWSWRQPW